MKRWNFAPIPLWQRRLLCCAVMLLASSCATYYNQQHSFNYEFEKGDLQQALTTLQENEKLGNSKSQFIYFVNNGLLLSILGKYEESNSFFEKAFLFGEDYHINYVNESLSYLTNPNMVMYRGEDHEHLMVLYFKAINFLKMNKPEEALIECRRMNIRLNQLSDKYSSDSKFQRDAFVHTLMGIIYQSTHDYNNAFIAYRNAVEVYEEDYGKMFGVGIPDQLKRDLLNTAKWIGFEKEYEEFKEKFGMADYEPSRPGADLVFFWHNGLAPVKSEWSINFIITHREQNLVVFENPQLGLAFPFHVKEDRERSDLRRLEVFRVAFPRYVERNIYFDRASIRTDSATYPLQLSEDVNAIAFHSLQQRMMFEFSKGLLRAALKKATEQTVKKEDPRLGALLGVVNALTEKADTRNWQTLPHSIYYARVPLHEGSNKIAFKLDGPADETSYDFTYNARSNQTLFHTFSSLETSSGVGRMY